MSKFNYEDRDVSINLLVGKTISAINKYDDSIVFVCSDGDTFEAYHMQDCCETVRVYDVSGNLQSLVGEEITFVIEDESKEWPNNVPTPDYVDSFTWTTHIFKTAKNIVTVRWLGESNGYYSESVYFGRTHKPISL